MTKLISILLAALVALPVYGGLPPTTAQGQLDSSGKVKFSFQAPNYGVTDIGGVKSLIETGNKNLLQNPSFEHSTYSTGWTITTASGSVDTTAANQYPSGGKQAAKLTFTASTGDILQSYVPNPTFDPSNVQMEASCKVKTTLAGIQVCNVKDGSDTNCVSVPATGTWQYVASSAPGSGFGNAIGVRVKATSSVTGTVTIDDCYYGPDRNLASGYMATDWASWTPTGSWSTNTTYVGYKRRDGDRADYKVLITTAGAPTSAQLTINLPSGEVIDTTKQPTTNSPVLGYGQAVDTGVQSYPLSVTYSSTTAVSVTAINAASTSALFSGLTQALPFTFGNTDTVEVSFSVPIVGWTSSQAAYKADVTPASWMGSSSLTGTTASASYADFGGISGSITTTTSRNLTCSAAASQVGVTCTLPLAGNYQVCWSGALNNTSSGAGVFVKLVDGSGTIVVGEQSGTAAAASGGMPAGSCGNYLSSAAGSVTFKLQGHTSGAGTMGVFPGSFSVVELDVPMPAPYLMGSVTSGSSSGIHTGWAKVSGGSVDTNCTSTPCTVNSQNLDTWVSSVTRGGTGSYTVNFTAGYFSSAPICTCSASQAGVQGTQCAPSGETTSSVSVANYAGAAAVDGFFRIQCSGPR